MGATTDYVKVTLLNGMFNPWAMLLGVVGLVVGYIIGRIV
jgi:hypothetical protein